MRILLYIILISSLVPATHLLAFIILFICFTVPNIEFFDTILLISSMLLGVCGYIGLIMLLNGFHTTKHLKKLVLLISGVTGYAIFIIYFRVINFTGWLFDFHYETLYEKWPIIVNLLFCFLIIHHLITNNERIDYT